VLDGVEGSKTDAMLAWVKPTPRASRPQSSAFAVTRGGSMLPPLWMLVPSDVVILVAVVLAVVVVTTETAHATVCSRARVV
jgi:hypothetical protein